MTPDERNMLTDLANKIAQTPAPPKDPEADELIRTKIGSRPDALYLMTQTVMIQNLALQHAQDQIRELQQRSSVPAQAGSGASFLGQGQSQGQGGYRESNYAQSSAPPQYAPPAPQYAPPAPQYAPANPSGAPSFLKGAAQTAAGVAAGALAFEGIQSLFSHPGYGGGGFSGGGWGGGGFGGGGFGGGAPVEETVVNNYYDSPQDSGRDDFRDDRDAGYDASNIDNTQDDSQFDDSNIDSGGGFDDNSGGGDNFV